ncbi:hypothetical protein, partial [Mammaliicoccus sciuri]|uniref:hypothetical protein n=1 Tax=Mammaliicoccus sciuri TaxID=1296 RepID=UPI003F9F4F02
TMITPSSQLTLTKGNKSWSSSMIQTNTYSDLVYPPIYPVKAFMFFPALSPDSVDNRITAFE